MMTSKMIWAIIVLGYFWVVAGNFDKWLWRRSMKNYQVGGTEKPQQGADVRK